MATKKPPDGEQPAFQIAEAADGLDGIVRAGRVKAAAAIREKGLERPVIRGKRALV
jgi:hypothetical protein